MKLNSWLTQRPRIGIAAAILAAVVVLYFILRPAAVPVDTAILTRGPLKVTVEEEG